MPELPITPTASTGNVPIAGRPASPSRKHDEATGFSIALSASIFNACDMQAGLDKSASPTPGDHQDPGEATERGVPTVDMDFDLSSLFGIALNLPPTPDAATLVISENGTNAGDWRAGPDSSRTAAPGGALDLAGLEIMESVTAATTAGSRRADPVHVGSVAPGSTVDLTGRKITASATTAAIAGDRRLGADKQMAGTTGSPARLDGPETVETVTTIVADQASLMAAGEQAGHGMTADRHVTGTASTELIEHGKRGRSNAETSLATSYEGKNGQNLQNSMAPTDGSARDPELRAAGDIDPSSGVNASGAGVAHAAKVGDKVRMEPAATQFIASHVESPAWSKDFGLSVIRLTNEGQKTAEIHLNPPDWGPIHVSLKMNGDDATVRMFAEHSGTREALAAALPQLKDIFEAGGLKIIDAAVTAENQTFTSSGSGSNSFSPSSQQSSAAKQPSVEESFVELVTSPVGKPGRSTDRKVDLFA
jgi:flagellar hook-length control protein FliK